MDRNDPPRAYRTGRAEDVVIHDVGRMSLDADEQITLTTPSGGEYDVARKEWGFYATPSMNGRLPRHGLRPVVVRNGLGRYFLLLVERGREDGFASYAETERLIIVAWLDSDEACAAVFDG